MTEVTQCPQCGTRFKVSQAQRESHQGMVRCGRCQAVFNAAAHLHDDEPSPQLSLPIEDMPPAEGGNTAPLVHTLTDISSRETPAGNSGPDTNDFSYLEDVYIPARPAKPAGRRWPSNASCCRSG